MINSYDIIELRFHGRGGQGAVTAAQLLVAAAVKEGKWGQAIPLFGAERRGAPVVAYARISSSRIPLHSKVKSPDVVVVLDPYILMFVNVLEGLKPGGSVVVNSKSPPKLDLKGIKLVYVDATSIAKKLGLVIAGWPVVNTAILGAIAKLGIVRVDSIVDAVKERWPGDLGERNAQAVIKAYELTRIERW